MPEKKVKTQFPDPNSPNGVILVDGYEVPIIQSIERWSEIQLEDGSILRVKSNVISAVRIDGKYDQEGNPMYAVKGSQIMAVVSTPDRLRKGADAGRIQ